MRARTVIAISASLLLVVSGGIQIPSAEATTKTKTFTNSAGITIPSSGNATPYPSEITVSGFKRGRIQSVIVKLDDFTHGIPGDVDVLLVGPTGVQTVVMSDAGGGSGNPVVDIDLAFNDKAASAIPFIGTGDVFAPGAYKPTDFVPLSNPEFPGAPPLVPRLGVFKGTDPNGTWKLFVRDDDSDGVGDIAAWSLRIKAAVR